MSEKLANVVGLADRYFAQVDQHEQDEIRKRRGRLAANVEQDLLNDMFDSLRRVRRKEMAAEVRLDSKGEQQVDLIVKAEYFLCPACLNKMQSRAVWVDMGAACLAGPWCENCASREVKAGSHEDGMTYGDSRVYTVEITEDLFIAVTLFMARLPPETGPRMKRDPITSLPIDEDHDELVF